MTEFSSVAKKYLEIMFKKGYFDVTGPEKQGYIALMSTPVGETTYEIYRALKHHTEVPGLLQGVLGLMNATMSGAESDQDLRDSRLQFMRVADQLPAGNGELLFTGNKIMPFMSKVENLGRSLAVLDNHQVS